MVSAAVRMTGKMYAMKEICVKPCIYHIVATVATTADHDLHAIDATPLDWSTRSRPTHWLIYAAQA